MKKVEKSYLERKIKELNSALKWYKKHDKGDVMVDIYDFRENFS